MNNTPIDWLLKGEPWVEYRARLDLLGQSEDDPQVKIHAPVHVDNASGTKLLWPSFPAGLARLSPATRAPDNPSTN